MYLPKQSGIHTGDFSAKALSVRQRFGTLAITLPSKYDDGEVSFSPGGAQSAPIFCI